MNGNTPSNPPAQPPASGTSFIVVLAALAAGALGMRIVDRTILKKQEDEGDDLGLAAPIPAAALPAPAPIPRPQIIRVEVPRGARVPEEFWQRLGSGGTPDDGFYD